MPKLRRLGTRILPANLNLASFELLENLTSLYIAFDEQTIRLLAVVGPKLKELSINPAYIYTRESYSCLPKVFSLCRNLEYLSLMDVSGTCDMNHSVPGPAKELKLKKLYLNGNSSNAIGLLPFLFSAPKLEEIKLGNFSASPHAVEIVTSLLSVEAIFQNLTKINLGKVYKNGVGKKKLLVAMENLATCILSLSPRLHTFQFNFDSLSEKFGEKYKIDPNSTFAHSLAAFKKM